jgi:hypothetical protein
MAGSSDTVRPSATFTGRWYGWSFAVVICAASLVAGARPAQGGVNVWTSAGPPGGGTVSALAIDPTTPTTLYAGTWDCSGDGCRSGVFKSTDAGATWSATGLTGDATTLAIDPVTPRTLYAGAYGRSPGSTSEDRDVFKSTDAGATWSATGLTHTHGGPLVIRSRHAQHTLRWGVRRGLQKHRRGRELGCS